MIYAYFERFSVLLLAIIYAKSEADDLSPADRAVLKDLLLRQEEALSNGRYW